MRNKTYSKFTIGLVAISLFGLALLGVTAYPRPYPLDKETFTVFRDQTLRSWRSEHGERPGLKVACVDVCFRADPAFFSREEGAVITPVGLDLPGGQKIIATAAYPPIVRELTVDGIKALAWPYPGKCRADLRFMALCLVQQPSKPEADDPSHPTFSTLPAYFRSDALARAKVLEEHGLEECAAFKDWPGTIAGQGTYIEQFKTLVTHIASGIIDPEAEKKEERSEDICASMRQLRFSRHRAHVLAVMACRQIGIPCFGFTAASGEENFLVGTFSDQGGWLYYDMAEPERGFFSDAPVLLTMAPLMSAFEGCVHGYWKATAGVYQDTAWGVGSFSTTKWGERHMDADVTLAKTFDLKE